MNSLDAAEAEEGGGFSLSLSERAGWRASRAVALYRSVGCAACVRAYCASVRPSREQGRGQDRVARSGIEDSTYLRGR